MKKKRDLLQEIGSHKCGSWQVQNLHNGPVGWRPRRANVPSLSLRAIWSADRIRKGQCCRWSLLAVCWQSLSRLQESGLFVLFKPSTDWKKSTHIMEDSLLYSKSTTLNVNLIQKHPHRNTQNNVWSNIWASHGPAKLTHKINHHKYTHCWLGIHTHLLKPCLSPNKDDNKVILPPNMIQPSCIQPKMH